MGIHVQNRNENKLTSSSTSLKKQMLWKKNGSKSILKIKMKAGTQGLIFDVIKCC